MELIETNRFILSQVTMDDADEMYKILSNDKVIENLNMDLHTSVKDTRKLIEEYLRELDNKTKFPYKIIEKNTGDFVGVFLIKLDLYDEDCFEFTIYLNENHWGKGTYKEVLPYMTEAAFEVAKTGNFRGFVMEHNIASRKVLADANFELEKVFNVPGMEAKIYSFLMTKERWQKIKNI